MKTVLIIASVAALLVSLVCLALGRENSSLSLSAWLRSDGSKEYAYSLLQKAYLRATQGAVFLGVAVIILVVRLALFK